MITFQRIAVVDCDSHLIVEVIMLVNDNCSIEVIKLVSKC